MRAAPGGRELGRLCFWGFAGFGAGVGLTRFLVRPQPCTPNPKNKTAKPTDSKPPQNKYTSPDRLCVEGRSAGGLLMGSVLNMRPDLFHAALAGVPFVDCLTTMLDETIPLTTSE